MANPKIAFFRVFRRAALKSFKGHMRLVGRGLAIAGRDFEYFDILSFRDFVTEPFLTEF
jgi:hypothetical protein